MWHLKKLCRAHSYYIHWPQWPQQHKNTHKDNNQEHKPFPKTLYKCLYEDCVGVCLFILPHMTWSPGLLGVPQLLADSCSSSCSSASSHHQDASAGKCVRQTRPWPGYYSETHTCTGINRHSSVFFNPSLVGENPSLVWLVDELVDDLEQVSQGREKKMQAKCREPIEQGRWFPVQPQTFTSV